MAQQVRRSRTDRARLPTVIPPASGSMPGHMTPQRANCLRRVPDALRAVEGPANLLCHYHDEKLWKLNAIQIKGRVENRDGAWVFVSTTFNAPSKLAMLSFIKGTRAVGPEVSRQARSRPSGSELGCGQGDSTPRQGQEWLDAVTPLRGCRRSESSERSQLTVRVRRNPLDHSRFHAHHRGVSGREPLRPSRGELERTRATSRRPVGVLDESRGP